MRASGATFRRARALFFPPFTPPSLSLIDCMKLRFESWRGSLREGGGTWLLLSRATGRQSRATAAVRDYEQREKIYNFTETRRRVRAFVVKMQSAGTEAFSPGTFRRFGVELAIRGALVLGGVGDEGGQELQSMAAACALTAWRPRETSDSPKDSGWCEGNAILRPCLSGKIFILTHKKCTLYLENRQKLPARSHGYIRYN